MENMFDLLKQEQEVTDIPGASSIFIKRGNIEFSNVTFSYNPEKQVLKNITFNASPGMTVAFVSNSFFLFISNTKKK